MKLDQMSREELARVYDTHLREAFPPSELKPLAAMERLLDRGLYDPLCLRDEDGTPLGFLLLWWHKSRRLGLIDYLCVPAGRRNGGIGGRMLHAMGTCYPEGTLFLAECEAVTGDPDRDGLILRRQEFYRRNGAAFLPYDCALFGVHFRVILWNGGGADLEEVQAMHREIYRDSLGEDCYQKYIQLPLAPGEKPIPMVAWTEEGLC